jgi:hypothetical protein
MLLRPSSNPVLLLEVVPYTNKPATEKEKQKKLVTALRLPDTKTDWPTDRLS